MMKIECFRGKGRQPFYFRIKATNGQVVAVSEGYSTASNRNRGAERLANMALDGVVIYDEQVK